MRREHRRLLLEELEDRRPLAVTAVDDVYRLSQNRDLHVGHEKAGYQSLIEVGPLEIGKAAQIEVSDRYGLLILRSVDGKYSRVIDINTRKEVSTRTAYTNFIDFSLSADGRFLFALESGHGVSSPPQGIVHRFDCETKNWVTIGARIGTRRIEAVSENRILLLEEGDFNLTLNAFDIDKRRIVEFDRIRTFANGDIEYAPNSGMVFIGNPKVNGRVHVVRMANDQLFDVQSTSLSGSAARGVTWEGTTVLSTDLSSLFYGRLQIEADDVSNNLHLYSDIIVAASSSVAFAENGNYFDSRNGQLLGKIRFPVGAIHASANNRDIWISNKETSHVHRFKLLNEKQGLLSNDLTGQGLQASATLETMPLRGQAIVNANGSFRYFPEKDFIGNDSFRYVLTDEYGARSTATVRLTIDSPVAHNQAPVAPDLAFYMDRNQQLRIEQATGAFHSGARQITEFPSQGNVLQIEYSSSTGLLAVRNSATKVRILDPKTKQVVSERSAHGSFTDMDLTPDGRFLMVADHDLIQPRQIQGGIKRSHKTFLHLYDMHTGVWTVLRSNSYVCRVEAVSSDLVLTAPCESPIALVLSKLSTAEGKLQELNRTPSIGESNFEYDSHTRRAYQSTSDVSAWQISNDRLVRQNDASVEPNTSEGKLITTLSADGKRLYVGRTQLNARYLNADAIRLRQVVYAASNELAFGLNEIYDISGRHVGKSNFDSEVHFVTDDSQDWWTFDPVTDVLKHYSLDGMRVGLLATASDVDGDSLGLELLDRPSNGTLSQIDKKGSVLYVPKTGFVGTDSFKYRVYDGRQNSEIRTVTIHVDDPTPVGQPPKTLDDNYVIDVGFQLSVGHNNAASPQIRKVRDLITLKDATQIAVSERYGIIAIATETGVQLYDLNSNSLIDTLKTRTRVAQIDLTPDERYLFVSEYGDIALDPPLDGLSSEDVKPRIHRFDIVSGQWVSKESARDSEGYFQAISRNRILQSRKPYFFHSNVSLIDFTDDRNTPLFELDSLSGDCNLLAQYDWRTRRAYCVDPSSNGNIIEIFGKALDRIIELPFTRLWNGNHETREGVSALSSKGEYYYLGGIQINLADRSFSRRTFPERILASTIDLAVGPKGFYVATDSRLVQSLPSTAAFAAANAAGTSIWIGEGRNLQQWQSAVATGVLENDVDFEGNGMQARVLSMPQHGVLQMNSNGSFTYTPRLGFSGTDTFTYTASSSNYVSGPTTVTIEVQGTWHNSNNECDVNSDGFVSPLDVLLIINALNLREDGRESSTAFVGFLDVDNDTRVSPIDVLLVINFLNNVSQLGFFGSPEGNDQYFSNLASEGEDVEPNLEERRVRSGLRKKLFDIPRRTIFTF